ncbi:MAG TPA: DNA methyltransferase [Candidatus Acidoferrum sp.]|nr:DNA methyltransferase [Candidatus Acidoferrum sp.]
MHTILFISGKNWKLSLSELVAYLKAREVKFGVEFSFKEFFTLNFDADFDAAVMPDLGGTIKIGKEKTKIPTKIIKEAFLDKKKQAQKQITETLASSSLVEEMNKSAEKMFFGVSVYCTENSLRPLSGTIQRFIGSAIKDELKGYNKKSKFMGFSKDRKAAQLSHVEVLKKNLVENKAEVLLCISKEETWVAQTVAVHNPFEFQKRDVYKPVQRKIFGMPPRIARIMVNLSSCRSGKVLLDPFCGVGTVLQEALLEGANVVGVDVNPWCVNASTENLEWIKREYSIENAEFRVVQGDIGRLAEKVGQETVDCIVTEPDLGPALRQIPTGPYAQKIIEKLEPLFFGLIEQAYRVLKENGKLVLVTPYIITRSGQSVTMLISKKLEKTGFKLVKPFSKDLFSKDSKNIEELTDLYSLIEVDERHKIGRQIHVCQK